MADTVHESRACQDTGNPVLDSLVNLMASLGWLKLDQMDLYHAKLLQLAAKEPGGLRHKTNTRSHADAGDQRVKKPARQTS